MAFPIRYDNSTLAQAVGGLFYNIDFAVGSGAPNLRTDVKLVQALLKLLYVDLAPAIESPSSLPVTKLADFDFPPLKVTGIADTHTRSMLILFQSDLVVAGFNVRPDGRFDPARGALQESRISHTQYAIELLNIAAAQNSTLVEGDLFMFFADRPYVQEHPDLLSAIDGTPRQIALAYAHGG